MKWEKLGHVYGSTGSTSWAKHSALQPTPIIMGDVIRVYAGFRDDAGVSRVGFVDLEASNPTIIRRASEFPALGVGAAGAFDQDGVVPCAVLERDGEIYLYYAGYLQCEAVRFQAFGGLAVSYDGGETFLRRSVVPLTDRTDEAMLFRVIHSIIHDNGSWKVWYGAGSTFRQGSSKTLPVYNIRYMESGDGFCFPKEGRVAIDTMGAEHRVGRPYVIRRGDGYIMFFGSGSEDSPYQLRYAVSPDGFTWERRGELDGLSLSEVGEDSQMMAYPSVVEVGGSVYMFYNGNSYGREGFSCARLISW